MKPKIINQISLKDIYSRIDNTFEKFSKTAREKEKERFKNFLENIKEENIISLLRYKKDWKLKAVQTKSIFESDLSLDDVCEFTNSKCVKLHIRINCIADDTVELNLDVSYFNK